MTSLTGALPAGTWVVDAAASSAQFRARDLLHRPVVGALPVLSASVHVSPDGTPSHVLADLDLAGVVTGSARRDRDLGGHRFFDVERSSLLRFTAGPARPDGDRRWLLPGELLLKGVHCPLEVVAELVDVADGRASVRATAALDRRAAGITVPRLLVGATVTITVEACLLAPGSGVGGGWHAPALPTR